MKLASTMVLVFVATLFGLWFAFVRAPAPAEVCDHIMEITIAEAGQAGMGDSTQASLVEQLRDQCIQHKVDKIELRGRLKYAEYAKCVMRGRTLAEIESC